MRNPGRRLFWIPAFAEMTSLRTVHDRMLMRRNLTFEPAYSDPFAGTEIRNIGLNVQQRSAVKHVDALNEQDITLSPEQLHYRHADLIGSSWVSGREQAPRLIIEKRLHSQAIPSRFVEPVYQDQMREQFGIGQAVFVILEHLYPAHGLRPERLNRGPALGLERRMDYPYWNNLHCPVPV